MRAIRVVPLLGLVIVACAGAGGPTRTADAVFRTAGVGAALDPTVRSARLVPEIVDEGQGYGTEPGGGVRAITAGLRVVSSREGAIVAAEDRLPQVPQLTISLPERLGGGFLFVLSSPASVWRAERWLDPAKPIFTSTSTIQSIVPGLDRVYLRIQNAYLAIDGRSGRALDLGPWPASPFVSSYAAADGWRAAAVTDLRGAVATFDAGATWRALDLPLEPRHVLATGDSLAVGGIESGRTEAWFELRADGSIARLAGPPREAKGKLLSMPQPGAPALGGAYPGRVIVPPSPTMTPATLDATARSSSTTSPPEESSQDAAARIFGKRPLAAAIEDGWPLTDGTAVVARDGALARVRLDDGALAEVAPGAFPLKPARCHPVSLTRQNAVGAFGFVCGEPRGPSAIYAYDPRRGGLAEIKRFDRPRVVTSSGNGALAVRGPCAEDGDPSATPREPARVLVKPDGGKLDGDGDAGPRQDKEAAAKERANEVHPFCVLGHDNLWREVHVRGDVGSERVVVLADGRLAVVTPPLGQNAPARLTLLDKGKVNTIPVVFPKVPADVARVLRLGVWLDGFEERRPGVVGGWIEAGGAMLGIEIALDGTATTGHLAHEGMPFVSGRYGLGWAASRRGLETVDGGMSWTSVDVPEPIVPLGKVDRRACGPVGCIAAGWLRVGWGAAKKPAAPAPPPPHRAAVSVSAPTITLACEPLNAPPPIPQASKPRAPTPTPPMPAAPRRFGGSPPVLGAVGTAMGVQDLPAFYAQAGPALRDSERGIAFEVRDLPERYPFVGTLARVYAWGPKTGDWDTLGKWQVKWLSPFAGWPEARASLPITPPQTILDFTKTGSAYGYSASLSSFSALFQLAAGDDSSHALLLAQRISRTERVPFELEADRAPIEIRRADGEPFAEIEAMTRASGRWFIATPAHTGSTSPVTTIWQVDGAIARELVKVSRAAVETGRPVGQRLARRSDNRAIGLVVDGQPTAERNVTTRWVLPIDLESGQLGEPEPLGYSDLAGRALDGCTDDLVGWVFDTSIPQSQVRVRLPQGSGSIQSAYARVRLTPTRACIERIAGIYDGQSAERAAQLARGGARAGAAPARAGEIIAVTLAAQSRMALRCTIAK